MKVVDENGELDQPFIAGSPRKPVQVFSPYGKEVVKTDARCFSGILAPSSLEGDSEVMVVIRSSVWINAVLFLGKLYAFFSSGSLAVLASLVDSTIDLLGQGVLMLTKQLASSRGSHGEYPIGRERLEPVGVMICAIVMGMASIEVISTSAKKLWKYWDNEDVPTVDLTLFTSCMLVAIIVLKALLWMWCMRVSKRHPGNDSVKAIAQDNQNDVISNFAALLAPMATHIATSYWVVDPSAGIIIAVYIIYTWLQTAIEQVELLVGKSADPETLRNIQGMAEHHHPNMQLDQICAYHFGPRLLVEVEVVMPESTTLRESHDAGISLQHKIEQLEDVERCFVHIDYQLREHDDHDPEVPLEAKLYGGPRPGSPRGANAIVLP